MIASRRRASASAAATESSGISSWQTTTWAHAKSASRPRTCSTVNARLAPGATAIWFSPAGSTMISAVPVAAVTVSTTPSTPIPSPASAARIAAPEASRPTQAISRTSAPSRRAATAWFAPLPPWFTSSVPLVTVSPGPGNRGAATVTSTLAEPTTRMRAAVIAPAGTAARGTSRRTARGPRASPPGSSARQRCDGFPHPARR